MESRRRAVLGVASARRQSANRVADAPLFDAVAETDDAPGYLFPMALFYLMVLGLAAYLYAVQSVITIGPLAIPELRSVVPSSIAGVPFDRIAVFRPARRNLASTSGTSGNSSSAR